MKRLIFFTLLLFITSLPLAAQIKLPRLISDGAILQRNTELKLWGWASPGETVELVFKQQKYTTQADNSGNWAIMLPQQPAGGPYTLHFKATNEVVVNDVLFGDVWVCSGQSNMELPMERIKEKYTTAIEQAQNKNIRQFLVADKYDFKKEHTDFDDGRWISATPETVMEFSAVAYFFANDLYAKYQIPIGLINAALGGSPVEAWMSEDALVPFPTAYETLQRFKNDTLIKEIESADRARSQAWYAALNAKDAGINQWNQPSFDDADWETIQLPGYWADGALGNVNGSVWFRKKVMIPKSMIGKPGKLWMGRMVDADSVFINGKFIGTTSYQYPPRRYAFGADALHEGDNNITVRVINNSGRGGFVLDKPYFLSVANDTLDLKGEWKYKQGAVMPALQGETFIRWKPAGLYNRMIAPLLNFKIAGVIWYQGESNTADAETYAKLFPALIRNWRNNWKQGDFPFLYVQLTNFMDAKSQPTESNWAALREAQRNTLSLPNTAMAVTIDVGEWNDIHPLNKLDVGNRLSLAAQRLSHGDQHVVYSGPTYQSHTVKKNKIIIHFSNTGGGLVAKGGELKQFAIAGTDKKFVWAQARIKGNTVEVSSKDVSKPVTVRYAWADNPEGANLYNKEGLPASPFTTTN